jgi:hypothetical protein
MESRWDMVILPRSPQKTLAKPQITLKNKVEMRVAPVCFQFAKISLNRVQKVISGNWWQLVLWHVCRSTGDLVWL